MIDSDATGAGPSSRARLFPLPLVGAAVLLAILIVLTPNLLSTGSPSAGSVESQLELLVDRAPSGDNGTHVYLRGLGLVRYQSLSLSWGSLNGSAPSNLSGFHWAHTVLSGPSLALETVISFRAFALNATGVFVDRSGAGVEFTGEYAFVWDGGTLDTTGYGPASGAGPSSPDQLPLLLLPPQQPFGGSA